MATVRAAKLAAPTDDRRWKLVETTMRRHGYEPDSLIEVLHSVQQSFGYLDKVALHYVASSLGVPLSQAYGVATFYHFFSMKPQGKHTCVVCLGTACYIKGGQAILDAVSEAYEVAAGQTTPDGELSLLTARCLGSCGLAPVAVIDDDTHAKLTVDQTLEAVHQVVGVDRHE